MNKIKTYYSDLICSECGSIFTIPRRLGSERKKYHIKDMQCYVCKKVTKFIELIDYDIVKKELEFSTKRNEFEEFVYNLLCKDEYERRRILK